MKMAIPYLVLLLAACVALKAQTAHPVSGVYRVHTGSKNGLEIWIVDGAKIREEIYPEFLYGGNGQRYRFIPAREIWVDNAVGAEELSYTIAHEMRERSLMARQGLTYGEAHDSALVSERQLRLHDRVAAGRHEKTLPGVSPTDCEGIKGIPSDPDTVLLRNIYRAYLGERGGMSVWVVDGAAVRRDVFPDFGLSGNDRAYHFIPEREIWIDGQISCEETEFSIELELRERALMMNGETYDDAYEKAISSVRDLRRRAAATAAHKLALPVPNPPDRDVGTGDENNPR
jgi:hypothetical protein